MSKTKKTRSKCAASGKNVEREEDDDPELQVVMDVARAEAASRGESTFMQGIAAGDAKEAFVAKKFAAAADSRATQSESKETEKEVGCAEDVKPTHKKKKRAIRQHENCRGTGDYWDPLPGKRLRSKQPPPANYVSHVPCVFNVQSDHMGKPAFCQPSRGFRCCMFCDPKQLEAALGKVHGSQRVTTCLKKLKEHNEDIFQAAMARIPEKYKTVCMNRVNAALARDAKNQDPTHVAASKKRSARHKEKVGAQWRRALDHRCRICFVCNVNLKHDPMSLGCPATPRAVKHAI